MADIRLYFFKFFIQYSYVLRKLHYLRWSWITKRVQVFIDPVLKQLTLTFRNVALVSIVTFQVNLHCIYGFLTTTTPMLRGQHNVVHSVGANIYCTYANSIFVLQSLCIYKCNSLCQYL